LSDVSEETSTHYQRLNILQCISESMHHMWALDVLWKEHTVVNIQKMHWEWFGECTNLRL